MALAGASAAIEDEAAAKATLPRTTALQAIFAGALLGLTTGLSVALVDFAHAWAGDVAGGRGALALSMSSLFSLLFAFAGALLGSWLLLIGRLARSGVTVVPGWRKWLLGSFAAFPCILGLFWVPQSWLAENGASFESKERLAVAAFYPIGLLVVVLASRLTWWVYDRYRTAAPGLPRAHWVVCGSALCVAAGLYYADARLLVDLYEDVHYGLAAAFVLSVAALVVAASVPWRRLRPQLWQRLVTPGPRLLGAWSLLLIASISLQLSPLSRTRATSATLYSKVTLSVLRYSDFDGDGYSAFLGGMDCAPLDAKIGPKQLDLPNNGVDEDCTGHDARWPRPRHKARYPVPNARGFNLLFITVDTLRADRTSAFGHSRRTTPHLERLAQQGLAFTRAYAQGTKTFESLPSLFTGLYLANLPRDYEHRRVRGRKSYMYTMTGEAETFTQPLAELGYRTRGIVALRWLDALGLDRGFDELAASEDISTDAVQYLASSPQPFFLWLHYFDPHEPYRNKRGHDFGDGELDRYDSEVAYTDEQIGKVLSELEARGLADKTVVVITADHGEEFREHGGQFHAHKLYEELLHVPLIVKVPGVAPGRIETLVELVDLAPTLCEALALRPHCADYDGQSLWATLSGQREQSPGYRGAYSEALMHDGALQKRSLRTDAFRFTVNLDSESVELFDVARDPREQHNLALEQPDKVAALREELALRPHRRLAAAFDAALKSDSRALVDALPLVRSDSLLAWAIDLIAARPSPGSRQALKRLEKRPGLSPNLRQKLRQLRAGE